MYAAVAQAVTLIACTDVGSNEEQLEDEDENQLEQDELESQDEELHELLEHEDEEQLLEDVLHELLEQLHELEEPQVVVATVAVVQAPVGGVAPLSET